MPPSAFSDLFSYLTQLMTTNASMFQSIGLQMFWSFAGIMVVWFGLQAALRGHFDMGRFANLLITIAFGLAMVKYYASPIPGFGVSFYHLIVDQGTVLANQINASMVTQVTTRLTDLYWNMETPGLMAVLNVMEVIRWAVTVLALIAALAAVFFVISFGYIAVAIGVLIGPLFIPFFIIPGMEWVFWGWLRAMLQYAFLPVVANCYVYVMGSVLINFVDRAGTDFSGARIAVLFVPLLFLLIAFTWGILKIPSLNNSFWSGKSGESALPF